MSSIQDMFSWAVNMCTNVPCAYTQSLETSDTAPYGLRNMGVKDGITYFDCASFVYFALIGGGFPVGDYYGGGHYAFNVTGMINTLPRLGFNSYDPADVAWQPGDIVAKVRTHTEIVYAAPRQTMGAHNTARGVSINDFQSSSTYYDVLFRHPDQPGPVPPGPTLPMPIWLIKKAIENQRGGIFI